ncbi:MAG: outer membrane lipoprotein-sorting protein [Nitrospirota bacterium]
MKRHFISGTSAAKGIIIAMMIAVPAYGLTPQAQRGLDIATETDRKDSGFGDYRVQGKMTLKSPNGDTSYRSFTMKTLEVSGDGDKRIVRFDEPKDLSGMVSLTYSHGLKPDDQWLYLPALGRVKRLAARDKTGSFAGSEFSFEDIATFEVNKYTYQYLRDDNLDGKSAFVLENKPAYAYSGYSRIMEWEDQTVYQPVRLLYYDVADRPFKELRLYNYAQFLGQYWRPMKIVMRNLQTGAESTIEWSNYQFRTGQKETQFQPDALEQWSN